MIGGRRIQSCRAAGGRASSRHRVGHGRLGRRVWDTDELPRRVWPVVCDHVREPSREFPGTFTLTEARLPDGTHPTARRGLRWGRQVKALRARCPSGAPRGRSGCPAGPTRAIPVTWGEYLGPDRQLRVPDRDSAYLVPDRCLGLEYGHFQLHEFELDDMTEPLGGFAALGYSTGTQMLDPACSVHAVRARSGNKAWLHDCALVAGDSGGPIMRPVRACSRAVREPVGGRVSRQRLRSPAGRRPHACPGGAACGGRGRTIEIVERAPFAEGAAFGSYERVIGRHFAVDPADPADAKIVDLPLAPREDRGLVTFAADFMVVSPSSRATGCSGPDGAGTSCRATVACRSSCRSRPRTGCR